MRTHSASSRITFGTGDFMMAPSSREVSPSALPSGSRRSLRVVGQFGSPETARLFSILTASASRKPSSSSGSRSSSPQMSLTVGARIAVVPLSSVGSPVITLSEPPVFRNLSTPQIVVARSAQHARILSERLSRLHVLRRTTPSSTSASPIAEPESSDDGNPGLQLELRAGAGHPSRLGTVVIGRGGRHRGPIHRGAYGTRRTFLRRWRAGRLSGLWRTIDGLLNPSGMHRRAGVTPIAALTSGPGHGSIQPPPPIERKD